MKRRELIAVLGSCVVWPFGARAQQPLKIHRIAHLRPEHPTTALLCKKR